MAQTVLFTGDSITDAGRRTDLDGHLGAGYVRRLDETFSERGLDVKTVNTGVSGNRAVDLRARWAVDVLAHRPAVVSVLIGINDTWRRFDSDDPTSADEFASAYRAVLEALNRHVTPTVVLIEPFLVPVRPGQAAWRVDLEPKIEAIHALARELDAVLVPADVELNRHAQRVGGEGITFDGVHLTELGHQLLADLWIEHVLLRAPGPRAHRPAGALPSFS